MTAQDIANSIKLLAVDIQDSTIYAIRHKDDQASKDELCLYLKQMQKYCRELSMSLEIHLVEKPKERE